MKEYICVLTSSSTIAIPENEVLEIKKYPCSIGYCNIRAFTRYEDLGFDERVSRELIIEARGLAPSLKVAVESFGDAAMMLPAYFSFACNAQCGVPIINLAFDVHPYQGDHEFMQVQTEKQEGPPLSSRLLNVSLTLEVIEAVFTSTEQTRISQAIALYHSSILQWKAGTEILALAPLYMAVETVTKVIREKKIEEKRLTLSKNNPGRLFNDEEARQALFDELGIQLKDFDPTVRLRYIFNNNQSVYNDAKQASDGFEHGFKSLSEIRELAARSRNQTAAYIRNAILDLLRLEEVSKKRLLSHPFDKPIGLGIISKYLLTTLRGSPSNFLAPEYLYPCFDWTSQLKDYRKIDGKLQATFDESFRLIAGSDITSENPTLQAWAFYR